MQWLFIAVVLSGVSYFLGARRRLDAFTVAFFSAAIYFLPGTVGYTLSPISRRSPIKLPVVLESEAIGIMLAVTVLILVGGILWDLVDRQRPTPGWVLEEAHLATWAALGLGFIGLAFTAVDSGGVAFTAEKKAGVMEVIGRGHLLWQMGATLGAALAFAHRQRVAALVAWLFLILDMWIGFRSAFAASFIAVCLLWLSRPEPFRLGLLRLRYLIVILAGGMLVISYQNLKAPLRAGDWNAISERVSNPLWYANGILTSEPFATQTVLNEIVRNDFRTGTDHLESTLNQLILFSNVLGQDAVRFNDLYQPALFPLVDYGLANNIWAQMWSAGDWPLLFAFVLVFLAVLAVWSRLLRSVDPAVQAYAAVAIAYWAFYIHRNELSGAVGSQKLLLLVWIGSIFVAITVAKLTEGAGGAGPLGVRHGR